MAINTLWHWAAFERDNYGDNLYSFIMKAICSRVGVEYRAVAFNSIPARDYGSPQCVSYGEFMDMHTENDFLVVGGGEILGTAYNRLFKYLDYTPDMEALPTHPYIAEGAKCPSAIISFGGRPNKAPNYIEKIKGQYKGNIWCRDVDTFDSIGRRGILAPDLATIISDIIPSNPKSGRALFQCAPHKSVGWRDILNNAGSHAVDLVPMSTAKGHNDHKFLYTLDGEFGTYSRVVGIERLTRKISSSSITMGSSLHLMIVSDSYSVPNKPINPQKVTKLGSYSKTWLTQGESVEVRKLGVYKALSKVLPFGAIDKDIWI